MKLLWLSWKDITNPLAGGAEVVTNQLLSRAVADGHEVVLLTAGYPGAAAEESRNGYRIIRVGGRWSVYWAAYRHYVKYLREWPDLVVEEINTIPFFSQWYAKDRRRLLFFHQLAREIWFYQMFFPLNLVGFFIEPIYLRLLSGNQVVTVSESTKQDLCFHGFTKKNIQIISEGIELKPLANLEQVAKYREFTVLSLGAVRPMKRTLDQLKAFELAKPELPEAKLVIAGAGEGEYLRRLQEAIAGSKYKEDIHYLGRVSPEQKIELMQRCHLILVTSVKEGWGLIVSEANSQGTPAAAYNVDGLRDSVRQGETGWLVKPSPPALAAAIIRAAHLPEEYAQKRQDAWEWSRQLTFERSYADFQRIIA